ncbi:TPA: hypothetical protein I8Y21_005010 [Klebsiella oxytoca]|uniref:Lipoprotein n=1 Tax=Klebsiella oxytoca TaxID=571 RepID=A0AAN5LDY6_KLEOX|nr:hypothetical protein [Klebsiella oxytoca]
MKTKSESVFMIIPGCIALSACSSPVLPGTTVVDTRTVRTDSGADVTVLTQHAINGDVIEDTDNTLNVVSRMDNAEAAGLKTLQFAAMLLGGGSGSISGYSKEQLKGTHISTVKNRTMEYLNPVLDATLNKINIPPGRKDKITVQPYKFKLIYNGLDNDNYDFIYSVTIRAGNFYHICSDNSLTAAESTRPYEVWEKNNYALTQAMAEKIITLCFEDINSGKNKEALTRALVSSGEGQQ